MSSDLGPFSIPTDPLGGIGTDPSVGGTRRAPADAARAVEGERRVITILFCDVVGSTAMAGQLDAEEWAEIMNEAFTYMIGPIEEYGGTVARLMGDAVLAFFGAPAAHEDDPQRAVLAGMTIVNGIRAFARGIREDYGLDFRVRVGINTGPVVVGEIGSSAAQEYTAMGDAINLAARMEQTALPSSVQISEETFRLVAPYFDVWPVDDLHVKGKEGPVRAYRVLGIESQPGRKRGIQGIETPLVGRAREFARLSAALDALRDGRSGIAFLIGEAGLGKSRLITELRQRWRDMVGQQRPGVSAGLSGWTEFVAVSYGASRPYDILKRQLRTFANLRESDPPSLVHTRLNGVAGLYPAELGARVHDVFGYLLGDADRPGLVATDGEMFRRELHNVLRDIVTFQSDQGPVVYVVDDAHWADPASVEALRNLLPLVHEKPILFVFAMRPDWSTPGWQLMLDAQLNYAEFCAAVYLEPLTNDDSRELARFVLGDSGMPESLFDLILEKGEGNPFFLEEVIRALLDAGAIAFQDGALRWQSAANPSDIAALVGVPENVQALLTARIDRLDREARRTLQLASVIGRTFPLKVLSHIADGIRLEAPLKRLEQADLLRNATTGADQELAFRHALTRDAAYSTILHRQRRRYHRRVAEAFEAFYQDRLGEEAPRLAYHYAEANDVPRSVHYYTLAGESAARLFANAEAVEHCSRGIELALRAPGAVEEGPLIRLFALKGRAYEVAGQHQEALDTYVQLEQLGQRLSSPRLEAAGLVRQATLHLVPTPHMDATRGKAAAGRALALAEAAGDPATAARAHWCLLLLYINLEPDGARAVEHGEKALALSREAGDVETMAYAMNDIARAYSMSGQIAEADAAFAQARDMWEELNNLPMLADALSMWAQMRQMQGQLKSAATLADEALAVSTRIGNLWGQSLSAFTLGSILIVLGRVSDGLQLLWYAMAVGDRAGFLAPRFSGTILLVWTYRQLGLPGYQRDELLDQMSVDAPSDDVYYGGAWSLRIPYAEGDLESAFRRTDALRANLHKQRDVEIAFIRALLAEIGSESGHHAEAIAWTDPVAEQVERGAAPAFAAMALRFRARTLATLGRADEARRMLRLALDVADRQEALFERAMVLAEIAALSDDESSAPAWREAHEAAAVIAAAIKEPELRQAYLNLPYNRQAAAVARGQAAAADDAAPPLPAGDVP
jgi:class 3 adenylate cyclase/tetratricopeptide (TPR) repeat protein